MAATTTTTYIGRIQRALLFENNADIWVAVGRTTAWPDEENPPDPSPSATDIDEAIVFVKAGTVTLCEEVESGEDVTVDGVKYAYVADVDAYDNDARFLFIEATFDADIHPHANYRQKGVFTELTPVAGHESDAWLAPSNVEDVGILNYIANKTEKSFGTGETRIERSVIEFR